MKPKTPEKIYITPNFDRRWQTKAIDDESVEYILVDTFIKKADKFISSFFYPDDTELKKIALDEFHKYMKGE